MSIFTTQQELILHFREHPPLTFSILRVEYPHTSLRAQDWIAQQDAVLIQFTHSLLTTQVDLSGVSPYVLLHFDESKQYLGASLSLGTAPGSFGIVAQSQQVLLLPFDSSLPIQTITHFSLNS